MNDITRKKYRNELEDEIVHAKIYDFIPFIVSFIQDIFLTNIVTFISLDVLFSLFRCYEYQ